MKIKEVAHVCIVVSNIERSIKFYKDLLGLELLVSKDVNSPGFSNGVGINNAKAKVALFKLHGENTLIELFEYTDPKSNYVGKKPANTVPLGHIALGVSNIDEFYKKLQSCGVEFISSPQEVFDGVRFCYFRDPDGALIELIEFPEQD